MGVRGALAAGPSISSMATKQRNKKAITKCFTSEEAEKLVHEVFKKESDPDNIFTEIAEKLLPDLMHGTPEESERAKQFLIGRSEEALMTTGLTHHYQLLDCVDRRYAALLLSMTRQIENDFECKTTAEKALAENIALAHVKVIDHSRQLHEALGQMGRSSTSIRSQEVEALSRQVDRANRQFLTGLTTLRQLKYPALQVNVISRNAFVAQNQQVNAEQTRT